MTKVKRQEKVEWFAERVTLWFIECELPLTMENIRRWFDLKKGKLPSEKAIKDIYNEIEKSGVSK